MHAVFKQDFGQVCQLSVLGQPQEEVENLPSLKTRGTYRPPPRRDGDHNDGM